MHFEILADHRLAICLNNADYPASLELHKLYRILPDEEAASDGDLRIIDESGEDYLYPAEYFVLVDFPDATAHLLQESLWLTTIRNRDVEEQYMKQTRS